MDESCLSDQMLHKISKVVEKLDKLSPAVKKEPASGGQVSAHLEYSQVGREPKVDTINRTKETYMHSRAKNRAFVLKKLAKKSVFKQILGQKYEKAES